MSAQSGQLQDSLMSCGAGNKPSPFRQVHYALGQAALQELDQRVDCSGAIPADGFPACSRDWRNGDLDVVELGSGNRRDDLALRDLQVEDGAVANIGTAARQPVLIIAVMLQVRAPRLPPE